MNAESIRRAISSGLAFALILAAPGIEPYRLLASVTGKVPVKIATPGLGSMAAGGAAGVNAVEATVKIGDQLDLGLNTALPTVGVTRLGMPPVASEAAAIPSVKAEAAGAPAAGTPGVHVEGSVSHIQSRAPPIAEKQKAVAKLLVRMALKNGVRSIEEAASPSARFGALKSIFSGGRKDSSETPVPVEALRRIESKVSQSPAAAGIRDGIRRSITDAEETAAKRADSGDAPDTPSAHGAKGKFWTKAVMSVAAVYGLSNVFDIFVDARDIPAATAFIVLNVALGAMAAALVGMRWYLKRSLDKPFHRAHTSDKKRTKKEWAKLSANLKRLGIDSYKTIKVKEEADHDRPTVAILAPPSTHKLPILQEGGRQSPGDVHLVFDASWLIQEELPGGKTRLLLKKGLYFDADGKAVVAEYKHPKQVRYFANFFTEGANERTDGNAFEKNLDVPQSSSLQLERTTNDKLLTRIWMAAKGVAVPATLALLMAAHPLNSEAAAQASSKNGVTVTRLPSVDAANRREDIRGRVETFLKDNAGRLGGEVVVKPSGPQWHSSKGVAFFKTTEIDAIVEHVLALEKSGEMTEDGSILIDQRLTPPALHYRSALLADDSEKSAHDSWGIRIDGAVGMDFLTRAEVESGKETPAKKDFNLGVYAMRAPWGRAKATDVMVRAGAWGKPTVSEPGGPNGDWKENIDGAATIIKYEDVIAMLREQHGLLATDAEAEAFTLKLKAAAEKALEAIWENEEKLERKDGEPYRAKTDFVRLDIMPHYQNGELVPMVIEVNDHDSGGQIQIDEFYPDRPGTHTREWIATMLDRARDDALKGKTIVVVGAGYEGKRFVFEKARKLGVKVVLVDRPGSWAASLVDEHIEVDTLNLGSDEAADRAMEALEKRGLARNIDGITSFWEDDVPTTASLAEKLKLPHFSHRSAVTARDKSATRGRMQKAGLPTPRFGYVNNENELEKAIERVGFPAVLKPASGAEAKMVIEVRSAAEARAAYAKVAAQLPELAAGDGAFSAKLGLLLEQYLEGDEVDVDLVMRGGAPAFDSITDNWPTRRPHFLATGSNLPSTLPADGQKALKKLAVETAKALGLNNGVLHIEAKLTPEGPRLIEANARMGGTYVHDWVEGVWGVDLVKESFMAAAGVPGPVFKSPAPLRHLSGEFLIPEKSGLLRTFETTEDINEDSTLYRLQRFKKPGQNVEVPPDGNDRVGMLTAQGRSAAEAAANLKSLRAKIKIDIKTGSADSFIQSPGEVETLRRPIDDGKPSS